MSTTGLDVFDKTVQTTNIWLDDIMERMGPDRHVAWHILGAVLRVLRDRLPLDDAAHLGAQLPLLVSVSATLIMCLPYLLLRLAAAFTEVRQAYLSAAAVGLAAMIGLGLVAPRSSRDRLREARVSDVRTGRRSQSMSRTVSSIAATT